MEQQIEMNEQERIETARPGDDDCIDAVDSDMVNNTVFFPSPHHLYILVYSG